MKKKIETILAPRRLRQRKRGLTIDVTSKRIFFLVLAHQPPSPCIFCFSFFFLSSLVYYLFVCVCWCIYNVGAGISTLRFLSFRRMHHSTHFPALRYFRVVQSLGWFLSTTTSYHPPNNNNNKNARNENGFYEGGNQSKLD